MPLRRAARDGSEPHLPEPAEATMLTDDGKHLYVSWDEYHLLI